VTEPPVAWYLQTAGAPREAGYQWYAITPGASPDAADAAQAAPVAGCAPGRIIDAPSPSLLLARGGDGAWLLYVGGLIPSGTPTENTRRIQTTVLGVAAPGADPAPLFAVAGHALLGGLDELLPVAWPGGVPRLEPDRPWPPPAPAGGAEGPEPCADESVGYPETEGRAVWDDLRALLDGPGWAQFDDERPLVLQSRRYGAGPAARTRPWRALCSDLTARTAWPATKESRRRGSADVPALVRSAEGGSVGDRRGDRGRAARPVARGGGAGAAQAAAGPGDRSRAAGFFWAGFGAGIAAAAVAAAVLALLGVLTGKFS
jgi:hypothetical protein